MYKDGAERDCLDGQSPVRSGWFPTNRQFSPFSVAGFSSRAILPILDAGKVLPVNEISPTPRVFRIVL